MQIEFSKYQGLGNDFIIIDCSEKGLENTIPEPETFVKKISQPHFGIGSDGVIFFEKSTFKDADCRMRVFTPDGTEISMSGNGIRCLAKYLYEKKLAGEKMKIETASGIKSPEIIEKNVKVNMGAPVLERKKVPMQGPDQNAINIPLKLSDRVVNITSMLLGTPQTIVFVDTYNFPIDALGKQIEMHPIFPKRTNVGFAQIVNKNEMNLCTWERGAGVTLACGTGASAAVVAGVLNNKTERNAVVHLLGGDLNVEWDEKTGNVYLAGPAKKVFDGRYEYRY